MLWHRQAIFESKGDKLSSSAECRIRTQRVSGTESPADWMHMHMHMRHMHIQIHIHIHTHTYRYTYTYTWPSALRLPHRQPSKTYSDIKMSAYQSSQLSEYSSHSPIINNVIYSCGFFLCVRIFFLVSRILKQSDKTTLRSSKLTKSYDTTSYRILKWVDHSDATPASLPLKLPTNRLFVQCPVQANDRSSVLLAHRVNSHRKGPVMRKAFPCDAGVMCCISSREQYTHLIHAPITTS